MKRPLTAACQRNGRPALLLALSLLLASCGSNTTPGGGTTNPGTLNARVEQPLISGLEDSGVVRLSSVTPGSVSVTVSGVPSGLTVTADPPRADGTDTLVQLTASGSAPRGSSVQLSVTAGGKSSSVTVPVLDVRVYPIHPAGATSSTYRVAAMQVQADGSLLLRAPASGDEQQRHSLLHFSPESGQFTFQTFPIPIGLETISSHTIAPDGRAWVSVRGLTAAGSYLLAMNQAGQVEKFAANTVDNLNSLTPTTDGLIWYTQYTNDRVMSLNPQTGAFTTYPVEENAESLTRGTNGELYYTRYPAKPAIVQLDPATGTTRTFAVGTANVSVPLALTAAPNGSIWFIESRSASVWNLNPTTGKQSQVNLPLGARPTELACAPDGTLWIADPSAGNLYRVGSGQSSSSTIPALKTAAGTPSGPRALTVTSSGQVWYEADGNLVTMQ